MWFSCVNSKSVLTAIASVVIIFEVTVSLYDLYHLYLQKENNKRRRRVRIKNIRETKNKLVKEHPASQKNGVEKGLIIPYMKQEDNFELTKNELATEDDVWNTALFFPDFFPDNPNSTTQQFIWYLQQTKKTMKICMYVSSFKLIEKAVFNLAEKKGVQVMGITNVNRVVNAWKKHGIRTREKPKVISSAFSKDVLVDTMHHKFIIIDNKAVLGGSLNWTSSGVRENRENVVITNNPGIVNKFLTEFDRLWELSEPDKADRIWKKKRESIPVAKIAPINKKQWIFPLPL